MAAILPVILGAVGSVAGGMLGSNQARDDATTAYNRTRELDQWLGQNQIQWRVSDLEKAGLNKILAAPGAFGGIGTQVAPSAQGGGSALASGVSNAASAGLGAQLQSAQVAQAQASARATNANAAMTEATTPTAEQFSRNYEAEIASKTTSAGAAAAGIGQIDKQLEVMDSQLQTMDVAREGQKLSNEQSARLQDLLVKSQELQNRLTAAKIPEAQAMSAAWQGVLEAAKKLGLDPAKPAEWTTAIDLAKAAPGNVAGLWRSLSNWFDSYRKAK